MVELEPLKSTTECSLLIALPSEPMRLARPKLEPREGLKFAPEQRSPVCEAKRGTVLFAQGLQKGNNVEPMEAQKGNNGEPREAERFQKNRGMLGQPRDYKKGNDREPIGKLRDSKKANNIPKIAIGNRQGLV